MATESESGTDSEYVAVADLADLERDGTAVVGADGRAVALFHHEGEVYAVDNRCPHMGFPLTRGTVEDGILTCHWHHARFELEAGDTFDIWADDVQTFPVEVRDGRVLIDPDPEPDVPPAVHWRNRLADGLHENLRLVMAKAVIGLDEAGRTARSDPERPGDPERTGGEGNESQVDGFHTPIETAVNFGTRYREMGWGRGLTTLGCMANLHADVGGRDKRRAMFLGVREVAAEAAGEPPRFGQYAFDNRDLPKERLKEWFRDCVEVRDADGAERVLLTALANLEEEAVADVLFTAATDHLYLNAGHTLDFVNKAFETLDHVGFDDHADAVLASTVRQLTGATRSEELSSWRQPVDIASLCFDAHDLLPDLVAAGEGRAWERPDGFVERLLSDDPEAIVDALTDAIREGATTTQLADAVARAATRRVAYFATNNEFSDWNTVHHTFTYANAVHRATLRTDAVELYRGCFDAAMSVYLDRFLNTPRAPLPTPGESDRDPGEIREELLSCFDEQGRVNRAAALVSEYFDLGGDPDDLKRTLGRGLLREDAGFHTLQNVEAAFRRFEAVEEDGERRLALMATARYMAAHFPTRREAEQTFSIATRLHRGERLHEAE
ncbi:Rieske (2Fe-2S) protein [Halomarina pelagica]|uniref:Rieske (2Fe-2S) protein n=1 Tax=Halomarina pelagica TaxID=2961599 RepID=UPI0020C30BFD|nr:Rieske 2Fe-2S domain-containing protein [Halomarina sp. BND7]